MDTGEVARSFLGLVGVPGYMIRTLLSRSPHADLAGSSSRSRPATVAAVRWLSRSQREWRTVLWNLSRQSARQPVSQSGEQDSLAGYRAAVPRLTFVFSHSVSRRIRPSQHPRRSTATGLAMKMTRAPCNTLTLSHENSSCLLLPYHRESSYTTVRTLSRAYYYARIYG